MRPFVVAGLVALCLAAAGPRRLVQPRGAVQLRDRRRRLCQADPVRRRFRSHRCDVRFGRHAAAKCGRTAEPGPRRASRSRCARRLKKGAANLPPDELAGLTADLIRLNRADEALNILQPLARDPRRGGFLAYAHLAAAHASRGEWREAYRAAADGRSLLRVPDIVRQADEAATDMAQARRARLLFAVPRPPRRGSPRPPAGRLCDCAKTWMRSSRPPSRQRSRRTRCGSSARTETTSPDASREAEQKKLPPDAIAIVQQLLLWHPQRSAALLAARRAVQRRWRGRDRGRDPGCLHVQHGLLEPGRHRAPSGAEGRPSMPRRAARAARAGEQQDEETAREQQAERDYQKRFWWILSIGVALGLMLVYYQFREVVRRFRRGS